MIPLRSVNAHSLENGSKLSFTGKKQKLKQSKNINISNLLDYDDDTMIERISLNSALYSTQRNSKTSKGTSRKKAFSKGDRFKILNQKLYTDQDFSVSNQNNEQDDIVQLYQFDVNERCNTSEARQSKYNSRPISSEAHRFKIKNDNDINLQRQLYNKNLNNTNSIIQKDANNSYYQKQSTMDFQDKENQGCEQKLQLFIRPQYLKQRDYLSIDVRSRKQSIGVDQRKMLTNKGDTSLTLNASNQQHDQNYDNYPNRRTSNSCMGKYTIDIPQTQSIANSQTINFQEKGIRCKTPSILSSSINTTTLTLNKSFTKGKKSLTSSNNGSLLSQVPNKKKLKIFQKKESKSPQPHEVVPFSVSSQYSRNAPLRLSKTPDLKIISILGAYDQINLGNFVFNKKQFKQYLKTLNFKTPQEEQQMIKYMFIYFKQWQKKINRNLDTIKLQLFSIKVEDLEEESKDIQRYIRKKANQAKRIKKCISVLLNYTKSKRDTRKLKQINQKCSEYDSLLKTINVIHTLKMRVEGYLINKIQKTSPLKTKIPTQQELNHVSYQNNYINPDDQYQDEENNNQQYASKVLDKNEFDQFKGIHAQQKRNSSISTHIFTANLDQDPSRAQSRRINMDLSDDDFQISQSRVNSEGVNLYDKRRSQENPNLILQQQQQILNNQHQVTPLTSQTPTMKSQQNKTDQQVNFYDVSMNQNFNEDIRSKDFGNALNIDFQKDVINIKSIKPISINNEEEEQQKNTINQASVDNMIKNNGSLNTNYQESFINGNSQEKQSPKFILNKQSINSQINEEKEEHDTPRRKQLNKKKQTNQNQVNPKLKFESLERVIKETIAEQSLSIKHKNIFQNYLDSIKIPLEDLQKQGEDAQHIFEIFNNLMASFEVKIQDHSRNCTDLNKWDILLQYLKDFAQLIDETVKLGSELMKLSQSRALPLNVTNRAVVYLQEAQEKYREVQGRVKDSLKELVNHMWELIEEGIHLNSCDVQYEQIFKFMASIRDSVRQSQVNDYQNKEKLQMIDEIALSLNELYKISYSIQSIVTTKKLEFVDSPSFSQIKEVKNLCHQFKAIYHNLMDRLVSQGDIPIYQNQNSYNQNKATSLNRGNQIASKQDTQQNKGVKGNLRIERTNKNGDLIGISLIERQCEEIEDLFEINRWFISNSQDIDNLIIFQDPQNIPEIYPPNEEGKRRFFSEISIGVGVILQLRENAEDIVDISGSQNLSNVIKNVKLAQQKYQNIANISVAAAELSNLQNFIYPKQPISDVDQQNDKNEGQYDSITHIYDCLNRIQLQFNHIIQNNEWFDKFFKRLINGTLYFDFVAGDYPFLCESMHSILSEYSSRNKYSIPSTEQFYNKKNIAEQKLEKVRKNNHLCENGIAQAIMNKISFLDQRITFAVNLFGSNNFVLPNGSLLCKILEAFFERIVHQKSFQKLCEQFEKLRNFMLKGIEIICKEKEVLCSKKMKENSNSLNTFSNEQEESQLQVLLNKKKPKSQTLYCHQIKNNNEIEPSLKSSHTTATAQGNNNLNTSQTISLSSAIKSQLKTEPYASSGIKKCQVIREIRFEQEQGSVSTNGKSSSVDYNEKFTGKLNYYDNILEEAENLCKHCSLFIPSREEENDLNNQEGELIKSFSIYQYDEFQQFVSRYLLAKRDKVNIYSNTQLRVKWIAPYNEDFSIFQQKYAFIQKYLLPPDSNSSQETIIEYTKHINQVFHKNGPIFYKYEFQTFQSYLQIYIDTPNSNFHIMITLLQDPSCILYSGNLENQKFITTLAINDIYANVKMTITSRDICQGSDQMMISQYSSRFNQNQERNNDDQEEQIQEYQNKQNNSSNRKQSKDKVSKIDSINSNIKVSQINKDQKTFVRHRSIHEFLMRAQKITQLRICNLNYNLKDDELFKIFYRQIENSQQNKSQTIFHKKPQIEVYAIINEKEVICRRKSISLDKNIFFTQNNQNTQEWTILQSYFKQNLEQNTNFIDFYVKINNVEEGSFYVYDKNNYYSIKSSLLLKQQDVLKEAGISSNEEDKDLIIKNVNNLLNQKYWYAFTIAGNNSFIERSRLTSQPSVLNDL
ncbi:hypothetical protein TTHERM_00637190 (macronuclear) [Tetrahymena thermophila SB210]|uniref:Uncharacterized protein n=1 Tax=Tetrahymena thermophila (strain SB210) TaxID=312017 RepID=Q22HI4_TETTS|nr:hypothetical protein TTHERM_00637190 [Tetrahymena thermophila SB210]EAR84717.2 hypothetical protein TTHERM_00637190 [Tetrahymena thermophila SB210]|eukprot:XP_001032380.2 hypothetical protein TTHERM_00637190 [Tetrahymena thermophila SB210]